MFTGLIQALGTVVAVQAEDAARLLTVGGAPWIPELALGDSVAVNGACLTVVGQHPGGCAFQAGPETLARTNLGRLVASDRVNLEKPLRAGDLLGGHIVLGHVDGQGTIIDRTREGDWDVVWFSCDRELTKYMVAKGSIAVDGVSLTLVDALSDRFSVALIPHTLANTTLGMKRSGDRVNLEVDVLGKYVEKLLGAYSAGTPAKAGVNH